MASIESRQKRHKIITSIPVATLLYGVPFAFMMSIMGRESFPWWLFMIVGMVFGLPMAIIMKRKLNNMPAMPRSNQDWTLGEYFKKDSLPTEPKLLKAMPEYLDKIEQQIDQSKKALPVMTAIGLGSIFFGFLNNSLFLEICGLPIVGMMVFSIFSLKKSAQKTQSLRERLQAKPKAL
jgi:hypothetical protein